MANLLFLVQDCRWSKAYRPANYLVLLLNFLHETGCDGTGCVVGVIANDDALKFVFALGRGHAGQGDRASLHAAGPVWKGKTAPGPRVLPGANGLIRSSELENRNG
jgi:hypothetical protein